MDITDKLKALIAVNSISSVNPVIDQGNRQLIELLANWFEPLGFEVEIIPLADPRKANLIATLGSGSGGLVLAGHTDTVPCDEQLWQQDPFALRETDDRYYGLGVCDMKGFFAMVLAAVQTFRDKEPTKPLIILATADEESSMAGAKALVESGKPSARYALIGEPSGMRPITSHKGIVVEKLRIVGRSGHSSNPALGQGTMPTLHRVLGELLSLQQELKERYKNPLFAVDYPTLNLGCINAGDNPNRICGHSDLGFEIRPLPGMDLDALKTELEARLLPLGKPEGVSVTMEHLLVPPYQADTNSELVARCEKLTGYRSEVVAFATEAPYLQQLGMDVLVMGPGDIDQAHQPNEYLERKRIDPMIRILEQLIAHYCFSQ